MTRPLPSQSDSPTPKRGFHLEWGGEAYLTLDEIWPDGNAPENPTREDVIAVMQRSGSLGRLLQDWNLEVEGVDVDGRDSGMR